METLESAMHSYIYFHFLCCVVRNIFSILHFVSSHKRMFREIIPFKSGTRKLMKIKKIVSLHCSISSYFSSGTSE